MRVTFPVQVAPYSINASIVRPSWGPGTTKARCGAQTVRGTRCRFRACFELMRQEGGRPIEYHFTCKIHQYTRRWW